MVSAICWIPKGAAKSLPLVEEPPTQEEIDEAIKSLSLDRSHDCDSVGDGDDDDMDIPDGAEKDAVEQAKGVAIALREDLVDSSDCIAAGLRGLNMENYDNEEDGPKIFGTTWDELYYPTNDMDPYLKQANDMDDDLDVEDDDEEIEDKTIKPTDMIIVTLHSNESYNHLEANVNPYWQVAILEELDNGELHMFPYHEIPLGHFPLCLAWSDCGLKDVQKGNFVAIGTMGPEIEIWDLDIVGCSEPHAVLGGKSKNKNGNSKQVTIYRKGSHRDSILGIAWNMEYKNILASASADRTIKIWDVAVGKCVTTLEHHNSKVQAVVWSLCSSEMILSGSFDKSVVLKDVKNCAPDCIRWSVEADVEALAWDPHNEHSFVVSLENGMVQAFDKRRASSSQNTSLAMFTLHAHEKAVSSISFGPCAPNVRHICIEQNPTIISDARETLGSIKQSAIMHSFGESESCTSSSPIGAYLIGSKELP
ncbi:putative WD repeat-containing protein C17D11.16 [Dichanthelium oligosanthes]|uniref:Putative WD repeat-containing protein C17D11.16 n=1 Tax=Dichanthelium oligosanthes TaxID=888268 RepID=A0A1E5WN42_9POAL|nr:putative WD repeat-containing protein C17D11.16 [Dichanthelium oligosanthes]